MVDTEVAICIRQCTSGIVNAVILCSLLAMIGGDGIGSGLVLVGHALADELCPSGCSSSRGVFCILARSSSGIRVLPCAVLL